MAQSMNTKVDLTIDATSYLGITNYGKVMVGDKAFEYYNGRNVDDYIQIPWNEIDYISASVMLGGKWINRFAIFTRGSGNYTFSSKDNKQLLRAINKYVPSDRMFKSDSFFKVIIRGLRRLYGR